MKSGTVGNSPKHMPEYRIVQVRYNKEGEAEFKNCGALFRTTGKKWADLVMGDLKLIVFTNENGKPFKTKDGRTIQPAPYRVVQVEKDEEGKDDFVTVGDIYTSEGKKTWGTLRIGKLRLPIFENKSRD